jgi:hypothetical protein
LRVGTIRFDPLQRIEADKKYINCFTCSAKEVFLVIDKQFVKLSVKLRNDCDARRPAAVAQRQGPLRPTRHICHPVNCACVGGGECNDATCPPREEMTGPEDAREGLKRPPANAWGNWASSPLAGNAGSAPIGGRSETPFVIGRGGFSTPGGYRDPPTERRKEGQYGTERDSVWTRGSARTKGREKIEREKKESGRG